MVDVKVDKELFRGRKGISRTRTGKQWAAEQGEPAGMKDESTTGNPLLCMPT